MNPSAFQISFSLSLYKISLNDECNWSLTSHFLIFECVEWPSRQNSSHRPVSIHLISFHLPLLFYLVRSHRQLDIEIKYSAHSLIVCLWHKKLCCFYFLHRYEEILLLDEPTSGLDSYNALIVMQLLQDLAQRNCTIICSIHQVTSSLHSSSIHFVVTSSLGFVFWWIHTLKLVHCKIEFLWCILCCVM
jgi:hypothetical protein